MTEITYEVVLNEDLKNIVKNAINEEYKAISLASESRRNLMSQIRKFKHYYPFWSLPSYLPFFRLPFTTKHVEHPIFAPQYESCYLSMSPGMYFCTITPLYGKRKRYSLEEYLVRDGVFTDTEYPRLTEHYHEYSEKV